MNRRSFFRFLGAGAATLALSEAIPFGRVWSFPSKIVVPKIVAVDLAYYSDFSVLYLQPAAIALANEIDARILADLRQHSTTRHMTRQVDVLYSHHPASLAQTSAMKRILCIRESLPA